jgi:hypothetical protein
VGPRAGLDAVAKRRRPYPCQESNRGRLASILVTILTELPRLSVNFVYTVISKRKSLFLKGTPMLILAFVFYSVRFALFKPKLEINSVDFKFHLTQSV